MILIPKPQKGSKENKITDQSLVGTQMLKSPIKNMQTKSKIQCSSYQYSKTTFYKNFLKSQSHIEAEKLYLK